MSFRVDLCSFKAAEYAVKHWHYSRSMPASKTFKVGAWEDGQFVGVVIFSWGSNRHLSKSMGLEMTQCVELTRVALKPGHKTPTSKVLAIAIKFLRKHNPGIECIVSYADIDQNHHGGIYQATNFYYLGMVEQNGGTPRYRIHGKVRHGRSVASLGWKQNLEWIRTNVDPNAEHVFTKGKHKYAMPFTDRVRKICEQQKQPYPKRPIVIDEAVEMTEQKWNKLKERAASIDVDAPAIQAGEGGSSPTAALHSNL